MTQVTHVVGEFVFNKITVLPIAGNVPGPVGTFNEICNEPLPKRKKADFS